MFAKKLVPLFAMILVVLLFAPQIASATSAATFTGTVDMQFDSYNAALNDETRNVVNDSEADNPSTWNPTYQGIWIGGATQESLYELNEVTTSDSKFIISSEFEFSSADIMSGASDVVVRLPFYIEAGMVNLSLCIYKVMNGSTYTFDVADGDALTHAGFMLLLPGMPSPNFTLVYQTPLDITDTSIVDGDAQYVIDNRCYVDVRCPIVSNQKYLFIAYVQYSQNMNFKTYISQDDVANDNILNSYMNRYILINPLTYHWASTNYSIDLGWSFDFRQGLGGSAMAMDFYMGAGATLKFYVILPGATGVNQYHSLQIPFWSANDTAKVSVSVEDLITGVVLWTKANHTYQGTIMAGDTGVHSAVDDYFTITITSAYPQILRFFFIDTGREIDQTNWVELTGNIVFFKLLSNYQITTSAYVSPVYAVGPAAITITPIINAPVISWGGVFCVLGMAAGIFLIATGIGIGPGILLFGGSLAVLVGSEYGKNTQLGNQLRGWLKGPIDAIANVLLGIGHFLWWVGEQLYNAFTWLYNAIVEYGSAILGLLVLLVIIIIFFFAIWFQLKIYGIFLRLAQGDMRGAIKEGQELASTIEKGVGKVV